MRALLARYGFRIQLRLIGAIVAAALLIALATGVLIVRGYQQLAQPLIEDDLPVLQRWSAALNELGRIHTQLVSVAADTLDANAELDTLAQRRIRLHMLLDALDTRLTDELADDRAPSSNTALFADFRRHTRRYIDEARTALRLFHAAPLEADRHRVAAALAFTELNQQLAAYFEARHKRIELDLKSRLDEQHLIAQLAGLGMIVLSLLIFLLIGRIARQLADFFGQVTQTLAALGAGRTDIEIDPGDPASEYGRVFGSLITFRRMLVERERVDRELRAARDTAEAADRMKSDFMANISHELRTPLNGVIGMTDLAAITDDPAERASYLATAHRASRDLARLIDDLLDFSDNHPAPADNTVFDLGTLLDDTLQRHRPGAQTKGLQLALELPAKPLPPLLGEPHALARAIDHLVDNAIKFSAQGRISVAVSLLGHTPDALTLHFAVDDEGPGIAVDARARIFQPFTQLDASRTRHQGGTGIGLNIVRKQVAQLGGELHLDSQPGKGSRFYFTLTLPTATVATFDYAHALAALNADVVAMLAPIFLEHYASDLARLSASVASGDSVAAATQARGLEGTLANFGDTPATRIADELARADAGQHPTLLTRLQAACDELAAALARVPPASPQ